MQYSSETVEHILAELNSANTLRDAGKTSEAISVFEKYIQHTDPAIAIKANNWLGIAYLNEGKHDEAEECYLRAYDLATVHALTLDLIGITRDRAINFINRKKFQEAEVSFLESLDLAEKYLPTGKEKDAIIGITQDKLGLLYFDMELFAQAEQAMTAGIELLKKADHEYWLLITQIDYARLLNASGRPDEARSLLDTLIPEAQRQGKEYKLAEAYVSAGDSALALKDNDSARAYLKHAEETVDSFDSEHVKNRFMAEINKRLALLTTVGLLLVIANTFNINIEPNLRPPVQMIVS